MRYPLIVFILLTTHLSARSREEERRFQQELYRQIRETEKEAENAKERMIEKVGIGVTCAIASGISVTVGQFTTAAVGMGTAVYQIKEGIRDGIEAKNKFAEVREMQKELNERDRFK